MEHSYRIKSGGLNLCNNLKSKLLIYFSFLFQFCKAAFWIISLILTMYLTLVVYKKCIIEISLSECIPLGSIFATFGSAVISVFSIYCGGQSSLFQENLAILRAEISDLHSWQRWPFLKRYTKEKLSFFHSNYYILLNPQITFTTNATSLTVPIPSCTADFKDLPVVVNAMKMIFFRRCYSKHIYSMRNTKQQTDLFIFDCVLMIYKNIIRYRGAALIMWIGAEFILSSIIFSFFYKQIDEFLPYLAAYF